MIPCLCMHEGKRCTICPVWQLPLVPGHHVAPGPLQHAMMGTGCAQQHVVTGDNTDLCFVHYGFAYLGDSLHHTLAASGSYVYGACASVSCRSKKFKALSSCKLFVDHAVQASASSFESPLVLGVH